MNDNKVIGGNGGLVAARAKRNKYHTALRRLKQDYLMLLHDPMPYIAAAPIPSDILEWHYVIRGPENTVYQGGFYYGKLKFPNEYPFKPPSIFMFTPNGRFKTNTRLCLSFSDFHPDTWNPTWSISTLLTGLLSFMLEEHTAVGSIQFPDHVRKSYARKSLQYNINNETFVELFPEIAEEIRTELERIETKAKENITKNNLKAPDDRLKAMPTPNSETGTSNRFVWSCLYNLIVLGILVLFGYIVRLVLSDKSLING